ncbi:MAG: glycosyltransferase family 39 protein [bacterium]|nr:glycosyltransferase family 39 protein [bacterium]
MNTELFQILKRRSHLWIGILCLGALLRLTLLSEVPRGFFRDEAAIGYDAYSILKTGRDHWGDFLPLFSRSLGDYDEALYRYLVIPAIPIFGLNEFSTRLPAALAGILTIWALHQLTARLFGPRIALFVALFLAISAWHIHFSRWAVRAILLPLFFCAGLSSFLKGLEKPRHLLWSAAAFAVCLHTYNAARVFVPLFLLGLMAIYWRTLWQHRKWGMASGVLFLAVLAPLFLFWISPEGMRRTYGTLVDEPGLIFPNYLSYFNPLFLFLQGDRHFRHSLLFMGQLHYLECITVLAGLYGLIRYKHSANPILWLWLALYPIPAAFTSETHAIRAIIGAPLFAILSGYGANTLWESIRSWRWSSIAATLAAVCLTANMLLYCKFYFIDYPKDTWYWWQYGIGQAIQYIEQSPLPCIIAEPLPFFSPTYIFILFYTQFPPERYHTLPVTMKEKNWEKTEKPLGKYYITDDIDPILAKGPCLLIVGPKMYKDFQKKGYLWRLEHTVQIPGLERMTRICVIYTTGQKAAP